MKHLTHYISSKMGVEGMTKGLARDLGAYGIRVNCIIVGAVEVEKYAQDFPDSNQLEKNVNAQQCIAGVLTPKDMEPVFAFLASSASDAISGQSIVVDNGWTHG